MHLLLLKLILTAGVCGLIGWSFAWPDKGFLAELGLLGPWGTVAVVVGFLLAVAAYARDLQRLLEAVPDRFRAARPKSVWLMFLIPYNFVEDFWIIGNVAASLKAQAAARGVTAGTFGLVSGLGWCALQILALVPHEVGSVAGLLAVPLWLWHWAYVRRARAAI
nr:hypothetical protein [Tabrizicola sp.]